MNLDTLTNIGLNETQAKAYIVLVKNGSLTPPQAAELLSIKRPNAYAVLDQLVEMGLAKKSDVNKKITYHVENPVALERLAKENRTKAHEHERHVQASMPTLLNYFYTFSAQPGVKFYQGTDGIREIYTDMLRTAKDVYVIRSPHDHDLLSTAYYEEFKTKKARAGIHTYMINPEVNKEVWNEKTDALHKTFRTQVSDQDYDASVEICSYGDKVSIISFGEEVIGMIIHSPQIAYAQKQIFTLAQRGCSS